MSKTGKLPGKNIHSVKRRASTRKSGFSSHPDTTGGELKIEHIKSLELTADVPIDLIFKFPSYDVGEIIGFGGWFYTETKITIHSEFEPFKKNVHFYEDSWSKFGSMIIANNLINEVILRIIPKEKGYIAFYGLDCGVIHHKHLDWAKEHNSILLSNMHTFSPEANFYTRHGKINIIQEVESNQEVEIFLKSCNRCARFLPINIPNERDTLSFTNHCVAIARRPCKHSSFGKLRNINTQEIIKLEYGYQLECRFCKKFEVNAAHNPQRTAAQMKEDGARRRAIEMLLMELFEGRSHIKFREEMGAELSDYVWEKFEGTCFNCDKKLESKKSMHLDHTRPLALLWPLDATATCLCKTCNTSKRDRFPKEFYSSVKLHELARVTKIEYDELANPAPNMVAIKLLGERLKWFFTDFCVKPEMLKVRDGKIAAELLIKALQKTLNKCHTGAPYNLKELYEQYNKEPRIN